MEVSSVNDVKIYNLSAGKSVPEWMTSEARRKLEKRNTDARRRIQLVQDFEMPDVSHTVNVTPDGQYVFASGSYKPFLKCYDLSNLSLKFERGLEADVIKVITLSEDFSKVIILEQERYIEMHATFGRYFRMRMPCYGRDMAYSVESSDLYLVGAKKDIYRLNLEQGEWLTPFSSMSTAVNCCQISSAHQLLVCGTSSGCVEAWDPRDKSPCGVLDCINPISKLIGERINAEVTSLAFADALQIGVGTSSGHVLLFDIRSSRPLLIKDHNNELPIKKIDFVKRDDGDVVLSMDSRMLKMWFFEDGQPFAAIENQQALNDFTRFVDSGLLFFANESPKMLQYFVPQLGPAPKWCSYLESLTEELEETESSVYDNYKFVTKKQLEELGLGGLEGTNVLRAYMHGYFIDTRLYEKARTLTQPFALDEYKANKVKSMMEGERDQDLAKKKAEKLPKINTKLAARLREEALHDRKTAVTSKEKKELKRANVATTLLADERFKNLFESTDFEVDETSETFERNATITKRTAEKKGVSVDDRQSSSDQASSSGEDDEEAPDDNNLSRERKKKQKQMRKEEVEQRRIAKLEQRNLSRKEEKTNRVASKPKKFVLHGVGASETTRKFVDESALETNNPAHQVSLKRKAASARRQNDGRTTTKTEETPFGGREMTFTMDKRASELRREKAKEKKASHVAERQAVTRKPTSLVTKGLKKLPSNLNIGKTNVPFR